MVVFGRLLTGGNSCPLLCGCRTSWPRPHAATSAALNNLQVGRYAEYFVKMELTLYGFEVFTTDVDDRGIDFVMRRRGSLFYEVQVKSCRKLNYVYFDKRHFEPRERLLVALVFLVDDSPPATYLITSTVWRPPQPPLFVSNDYVGKKSAADYGINLS